MGDAPALEGYQEGSRWINQPPTGEQVSEWFLNNVELDEGMDPSEWVRGITIIPAKERYKQSRLGSDGKVTVDDGLERMVYTPYSKVEARVAYFWKLMDQQGTRGELDLVPTPGLSQGSAVFFQTEVSDKDGKPVRFIGASACASIYDTSEMKYGHGHQGRLLKRSPIGTKVVPRRDRWGNPDVNAVMKAQTGAVGRALGFLGVLVIPGSGIATAEDMQEALGTDAAAQAAAELPDVQGEVEAQTGEGQLELANRLLKELEDDYPERFEGLKEWAVGRGIKVDTLKDGDPALRAVIRNAEQGLQDAKKDT